ncbi:hypothetical protein Tco_0571589 [Tanacetum coccineum]
MLSLRERKELDLEARLIGETLVLNRSLDPFLEDYIKLNDLNEPFELRRNQGDDLMPIIKEGEIIEEFRTRDEDLDTGINDYPIYCDDDKKIHIDCAYNLKFSCIIGFEFTHANFFPLLYVNAMSKKFHNSIMKDKMVYKGNNVVGALMNIPIFVGTFSIKTDFAILEDMDAYLDEGMGDDLEKEISTNIGSPEQPTQGRGDESNRIPMVMIHRMLYPITMEVLHQVLSPHGYDEKVGRNIYEGCCQPDIQFLNLEELQVNQDENICYYYRENCFLIINADEADNTKPSLSADTFRNNGGDDSKSSSPVKPTEELMGNEHSSILFSLVEHRSSCSFQLWETIADMSASYGEGSAIPGGTEDHKGKLHENRRRTPNRPILRITLRTRRWRMKKFTAYCSSVKKIILFFELLFDEVLFMASDGSDRDTKYALSKLLQIGMVTEYQNEFEMLINRVTGISKSLLKSFYISGLKLALQLELLRSKPTTLGEAFSLARIAKARFKDERPTIAIAKPNDLTVRVQVQDSE